MSDDSSSPLRTLQRIIGQFERSEVAVEVLQAAIRSAEDSLTEYELRDLRVFLQSAEGKLELIRFTVDSEHVLEQALKVAQDVGSRIQAVLGQASPD